MRTPTPLPVEGDLPSLGGATAWINSQPLTPVGLRGKVVVVDFWTYTCINWLRTLPYIRAWAAKYGDRGLVVIGVHTPEFSVEHELANVRRAASEMRVEYPIAVDNDYAVWRAFHNDYWPALYIADAQGRIRFHHFGEGEYEESERVIQQLLKEAGAVGIGPDLVSVDPQGSEVAADWSDVQSPENYVGYEKAEGLRRAAAPCGTSATSMRRPRSSTSIIGRSRATGRCGGSRFCRMPPEGASCIAFTREISTSPWAPVSAACRCDFACGSTDGLRAPRTDRTSMRRATARFRSRACIS